MKRRLMRVVMTAALLISGVTQAQFQFSLPGLPGVTLPNIGLPALPFTPGNAVTTALTDAFPVADWLNVLQDSASPVAGPGASGAAFNLAPGFYRFVLQSYCLHAGTYSPAEGAGYPLAPLKGDRAELIRAILQRSASVPNVAQSDVQTLLWGIEAGTRFTDYSPEFQLRVSPLLTPADIALTFVSLPALGGVLPGPLRDALAYYDQFRGALVQANADYASLERLAVLAGAAPLGPGSRTLPAGVWTSAGPGFYARAFPEGYSRTVLEVVRTAPFILQRDARGRIVRFSSGGYTAETTYDDAPGQAELAADSHVLPVWRFATVRLSGPGGETVQLKNRGFVVPSDVLRFGTPRSTLFDQPWFTQLSGTGDMALWRARSDRAWKLYGSISAYRALYGRGTLPPAEEAINDFTDLEHYRDGLTDALGGEVTGWLTAHVLRQRSALEYAVCVLSGECKPGDTAPASDVYPFDPTQYVATPANTSMQRLGLSVRFRD